MDQWLVRTARNVISGPFSREQLMLLIRDGELGLEDEVCLASDYWFYLHEEAEVVKHLGANIPVAPEHDDDEEVTETQTQVLESPEPAPHYEDFPELDEAGDGPADNTAMISNRALREFQPKPKSTGGTTVQSAPVGSVMRPSIMAGQTRHGPQTSMYKPVVLGRMERSSFWRGFALFLAGIVITLVIIVIYVLRHV